MAGSPRSTSAAPRAPRTLSGTQRPACAETAGSTPAVSTDLKTTCKTNATAPTKTRRPPNLDSRVPVTVPTSQTLSCLARTARPCPGRGYEPPGLGACNGRNEEHTSELQSRQYLVC